MRLSRGDSRGLQQDSQRRAKRRGTTAVFAARWPAKTDQRTRTGAQAEQVKKCGPQLERRGPQTQV
jgi:hypothetical protein